MLDPTRSTPSEAVPTERLRAALDLLYPEEMTPTARRVLESLCEEHGGGGKRMSATDSGDYVGMCEATPPDGGRFVCTLTAGHTGRHEAWGVVDLMRTWPDA